MQGDAAEECTIWGRSRSAAVRGKIQPFTFDNFAVRPIPRRFPFILGAWGLLY